MAGYQSVRGNADAESIEDWMERRRTDLARLGDAIATGREAWDGATRTGQNVQAMTSGDLLTLGRQILRQRETAGPATTNFHTTSGGLSTAVDTRTRRPPATDPEDLTNLRLQQAAFHKVRDDLDRQNSWLSVPALAPAAVVLGLEGAGIIAARMAGQAAKQIPLRLIDREIYRRVGDNWATRAGRLAHKALAERVKQKPGWESEPILRGRNGQQLRPDVGTPKRGPQEAPRGNYLELKPNTPTGRRAAARAVKKYKDATNRKVRSIFYDPKDYL